IRVLFRSHKASQLRACGDYFGVHVHPIRWSAKRQSFVHDVGDPAWLRECTHASLDAFERWNGSAAKLFRAGAGFLSEDILEVLDERGVEIEMSLEPVASWALDASEVATAVDSSPIIGSYVYCTRAPNRPYHPRLDDFRR